MAAITAISALVVRGQDIPDTKEAVVVPQTATLLTTASNLVKYGYNEQEALPLIQAAEIYTNLAGPKMDVTPEHEGEAAEIDEKGENPVTTDPVKLLADAATFADGDATLLALIDKVKNSATRGTVGGPTYTTSCVNANTTDVYNVRFRAGQQAAVFVSGDGDTDLDLFIYDANGNLVASDTDYGDDCLCIWTPRWTGNFKIKIKNYGRVYNCYTLRTN